MWKSWNGWQDSPDRIVTTFNSSTPNSGIPAISSRKKVLVFTISKIYIAGVNSEQDTRFMQLAIREAELAFEKGEVPVGALIVFEGNVIGRGHNLVESLHDATAHAEMIALSAAYSHFGDWRLEQCHLYCTLEPCSMCAGAAVLSRLATITFGASDPKFGACGSIFNIPAESKLNHQIEINAGLCADEIAEMMKFFFKQARAKNSKVN